ncbi:NAD-P-binding protein [Stereum hirsutum FP-91666 SS1]|uniref:NAD-P-binding protein n=1 Tax=Stereum hirsutum (strain FP-91666) TaxID=721885 RepID=UPI000440EC59|nr:NAD-P-binding protein [Stereum hirsutum FP-91666 SS1]EIM87483.1 NAD-P-binding protein [Stereum hirsutum FP-91666 SS1]
MASEEPAETTGVRFTKTIHSDTYAFIDPLKPPASHKLHSVFISGASKGIGRSIALSFARSGASRIAIGARSSLDSVEAEILGAAQGGAKNAAEEVAKAFGDGGVDFLVNNAGFSAGMKPFAGPDVDVWWHTWEVNVRGLFFVTHAFLPLVLKSKEKTIINLDSMIALEARPGVRDFLISLQDVSDKTYGLFFVSSQFSSYSAGKLAILRLTEFINVEHGAEGIISYAVNPGTVFTDMAKVLPPEVHRFITDTPELPADTIAFLTRERRGWLAGRYLSCTWDMEELMSRQAEIVQKDKLKVRIVL